MSVYFYLKNKLVGFIIVVVASLVLIACTNNSGAVPVIAEHEKWLPESSKVSGAYMKEHEVTYEKAGYRMRYVVSSVSYKEESAWKYEIYFEGSGNGEPDTIYLSKDNLSFLGRVLSMPQYTIDVHFRDNLFQGSLSPAEGSDYKPVIYNKTYPHGGFEPAIINYAILGLPLSVGFKASIPVFDLNNGSQMFWSNIEVVAKEHVELNGQQIQAFKVISNGIKNKTIWLSTDYPYALKMETEGSFGVWEIAE